MSLSEIGAMKPQANDLVVVPIEMELPGSVPFLVHKMKFLHKPSIIRSGGYSMGMLDSLSIGAIAGWLGIKPAPAVTQDDVQNKLEPRTSLRDLVFDKDEFGIMRGDSTMHAGPSFLHKQPQAVQEGEGATINGFDLGELGPVVHFPDAKLVVGRAPSPGVMKEVRKYSTLPKFWRYHRQNQVGKTAKGNPATGLEAKGGVAFYIELDPANKTFAFSYCLCHSNDNFNYATARHISKQRFDNDDWYEVKNYDGTRSVIENIGEAISNELYNREIDDTIDIVFSSLSERMKESELKLIYERL